MKNPTASEMGRKGGAVKSEQKTQAARANGAKGGAPRKLKCQYCSTSLAQCQHWKSLGHAACCPECKHPETTQSRRYCEPCDSWHTALECPACGSPTLKRQKETS